MSRLAAALVLGLAGCAARSAIFSPAPVVWRVDDDRDIPEPEEDDTPIESVLADAALFHPVDRALALPRLQPARDTNALDEVPDSTWFENRIGRRALSPAEVARGPGGEPPRPPLQVTSGKSGSRPGFLARDASGRRFLIKLDPVERPESETAAAAITSRLFWAAGYHVPSEHVVELPREEIAIARGATYRTEAGDEAPFVLSHLEAILGRNVPGRPVRVLASELLPGEPKGGFWAYGRRPDDPNDLIPHQHRRVLRGLRVFSAWLDHTDINEKNTLDTYVREGGRRFLRHHLVDFGQTLGLHGPEHPWVSHQYVVDPTAVLGNLLSLGLVTARWEDEPPPPHRSLGRFHRDLDPHRWREDKPYAPFLEMTPADAFWAAKIVQRFTYAHLAAAVEQGQLSDPSARAHLLDALWSRARHVGFAYLNGVTALDDFLVSEDRLCARDLSVVHGLAARGSVERMEDGEILERARVAADGRVCVVGPGPSSYAIVRLRTRRGRQVLPQVEVHVQGGPNARVRGIARDF